MLMETNAVERNGREFGGANVRLQVCLAETEPKIRRDVANAIREAGHLATLATGPLDVLRQSRKKGVEPDVLVGCASFMEAMATMGAHSMTAPSLLLARPEDSSCLRAFISRHPANEVAVLPQSEESLRTCIVGFLNRQESTRRPRTLRRGSYQLHSERLIVEFPGHRVSLSPAKFALAQIIFEKAGQSISAAEIYRTAFGGERKDFERLIDSNISFLGHVLSLDGSHGHVMRKESPGVYCLENTLETSSEKGEFLDGEIGAMPQRGGNHYSVEH